MRRSVHPVAYGIKRAQSLQDAVTSVSAVINIPIGLSVGAVTQATLVRRQEGFKICLPAAVTWLAQATLLGMALGRIVQDRSCIDVGDVEEIQFPRSPVSSEEQSRQERFTQAFVETLLNMTPTPLRGLFG